MTNQAPQQAAQEATKSSQGDGSQALISAVGRIMGEGHQVTQALTRTASSPSPARNKIDPQGAQFKSFMRTINEGTQVEPGEESEDFNHDDFEDTSTGSLWH